MAELNNSNFSQDFSKTLSDNGFLVSAERIPTVVSILFQGGVKFLKDSFKKDKDATSYAIKFGDDPYNKDPNKTVNTIFCMVLSKVKSEDDDSFNLQFSFDESIIPEDAVVKDFFTSEVFDYFRLIALENFGATFVSQAGMSSIQIVFVKLIQYFKEYIRNNLDDDNVLESKDYFKIEGTVDDETKNISFKIIPSELMKQFVKADDTKSEA